MLKGEENRVGSVLACKPDDFSQPNLARSRSVRVAASVPHVLDFELALRLVKKALFSGRRLFLRSQALRLWSQALRL